MTRRSATATPAPEPRPEPDPARELLRRSMSLQTSYDRLQGDAIDPAPMQRRWAALRQLADNGKPVSAEVLGEALGISAQVILQHYRYRLIGPWRITATDRSPSTLFTVSSAAGFSAW